MNCYCDWLEAPEVYRERRYVARKKHKCSECNGVIARGETYLRCEGLWDGRWKTFKRCSDCLTVLCDVDKLNGGGWCICVGFGALAQELCDMLYGVGDDYLQHLLPVIGAFNAASKARGGIQIKCSR